EHRALRLARPPLPAVRGRRHRLRLALHARAPAGLPRHRGDRGVLRVLGPHAAGAQLARRGGEAGRLGRVELRADGRPRRPALDPDRPDQRPDDPRRLRRLDDDPPLLDLLHGRRRGLRALLRVPELLRVLDVAADPGRQLPDPDRRLGVRRRRLVPAGLLLVPPDHGDAGGHQGVRDQRGRRRRPRARHLLRVRRHRLGRLPHHLRARPRGVRGQRRQPRRGLPADPRRRLRQVRPGAAAHLAAGRDGGAHARLRADPRRHHGDRRRVPDRAHAPALRAGAGGRRRRRHRRLRDAVHRRHDRPGGHRRQADHRLLDDVADRLHDHGRVLGRLLGRALPPDDARVLQGAAVHGRRIADRRDGGRAGPQPDLGLPQGDAVHLRLLHHRRPGAGRHAAVRRLLLQGRDPRPGGRSRGLARDPGRGRLHGVADDRHLHLPPDLPRLLGRCVARGARARARAPLPRRGAPQPGQRRARGHRRRLPRPG
ncbi:MAG: NADH-ubiquinone oxidoreductase chain L, partial [uncultured Solirubrobacteraceae bacterium]